MKILTNDGIYVQKNDMAYLTHSETAIPASIFMSVFGVGSYTIIDDSNRYEFIKFTGKEEVEFLKSLDWIVDYNAVKDLTQDELEKMFNELAEKRKTLAQKFNNMPIDERMKNVDIIEMCENLRFKMLSINDVNLFRSGKLAMTLPEGFERTIIEEEKTSGFQKIIKRIFKKNS